jgi:chromosome segregation ATPase
MARLESLTSSQDELEQTTALRLAAGIEREKADREKAQAGLAQQVSALSLSLDEESKAREALGLDMLARQAQLESALTRKIDSAIEGENADRKAAYAELSSKIDAFSLSLGKELETERAQREAADIAHQEEARRILDEIAAARRDITDIERKTAEADAAIIAALEIQESRVAELGAELARLAADVRTLQEYAAGIEAELLQMSEKTSEDYASQQAALAELAKALDQTSADLSAAIKANAAEDLKTNGRVLQNTMRIQDVARSLDATNERLGQTDIAVRQAEGSIEEITARLAEIDSHLASIDRLLAGSVDELAKRFSDDLVVERWEAEMREVKLQSMIEELEARVEKLEGEKAQADAKKPGSAGAIVAVLGVIAAVAAIAIGSGGK